MTATDLNRPITLGDLTKLIGDLRNDFSAELKAGLADLRSELKADIAALRAEFKSDIVELRTGLRAEFKAGIADLRNELKTDIADLRNDFRAEIQAGFAGVAEAIDSVLTLVDENYQFQKHQAKQIASLDRRVVVLESSVARWQKA